MSSKSPRALRRLPASLDGHRAARRELVTWGFYHRILRLRDRAQIPLLDARVRELGCSGRRDEAPQGARGLARHPAI